MQQGGHEQAVVLSVITRKSCWLDSDSSLGCWGEPERNGCVSSDPLGKQKLEAMWGEILKDSFSQL